MNRLARLFQTLLAKLSAHLRLHRTWNKLAQARFQLLVAVLIALLYLVLVHLLNIRIYPDLVNWQTFGYGYGFFPHALVLAPVSALAMIYGKRYLIGAGLGLCSASYVDPVRGLVTAGVSAESELSVLLSASVLLIAFLTTLLVQKIIPTQRYFQSLPGYSRYVVGVFGLILPMMIACTGMLLAMQIVELPAYWNFILGFVGTNLYVLLAVLPGCVLWFSPRYLLQLKSYEGLLLVLLTLSLLVPGEWLSFSGIEKTLVHGLYLIGASTLLLYSALRLQARVLFWVLLWFMSQANHHFLSMFSGLIQQLGGVEIAKSLVGQRILLQGHVLFQIFILISGVFANLIRLSQVRSAPRMRNVVRRIAHYRAILDGLPEALLLYSLHPPKILEINLATTQLLGYPRSRMLGQNPYSFNALQLGPTLHDRVKELTECAIHGEPVTTPWVMLHANGQPIQCELHLLALPEDRHKKLLLARLRDMSGKTDIQNPIQNVSDQPAQLLAIQQLPIMHMSIPCVLKDSQQRFIYWNFAAENLFGYRSYEVIGKKAEEIIVSITDIEEVVEQTKRLSAGEALACTTNSNLTRDSNELVCEWYHAALRASDGQVFGFMAIVFDVTDRTKAERDLRESEGRYRRMVEASIDGICIHREGKLLYVNQAFANMVHAFSRTEIIGHSLLEFTAPDFREQIQQLIFDPPLELEQAIYHESILLCVDGHQVDVEITSSAIYIDGLPYQQIEIRDISVQKSSERAMKKANTELEQRVVARTTDLEQANRELEAFSYSVAHDLRAPLRAIVGFSSIFQEECGNTLDEEAQSYLRKINDNANKMAKLIEDLLDYARIVRTEIKLEPVNLNLLVEQISAELIEQSPKHQIVIREMPIVLGDPILLRQLLVNLLSNACKFSRAIEQPLIEVGFDSNLESGVFYVRDNGVGFDQQYAHKLFGVFQRLHSVNEYEGTGVGLAIVQRVVSRHGGRIWGIGVPGEGATFYFTLPLSQSLF